MEAIRQFVKVKNHRVTIILPEDFNAEEVEVIILPNSKKYQIPQVQINEAIEQTTLYFKNTLTELDHFTLSNEDKILLEFRDKQPKEDFISAEESVNRLKKKYGV